MRRDIVTFNSILPDDDNEYKINEYFSFHNEKGELILIARYPDDYANYPAEAAPITFLHALYCALPKILISAHLSKSDDHDVRVSSWDTNVLFSYYGDHQYKAKDNFIIKSEDIEVIRKWHIRLLDHNKASIENIEIRFTSWNVALNEYIEACICSKAEHCFMYLITALEALLLEGNSELNYRVALYSSIICGSSADTRKEIFELIKKCYGLRSKVVHGDKDGIIKSFKNQGIYDLLFELKRIVSKILYASYNISKEDILEKLKNAIFESPEVIL